MGVNRLPERREIVAECRPEAGQPFFGSIKHQWSPGPQRLQVRDEIRTPLPDKEMHQGPALGVGRGHLSRIAKAIFIADQCF